MELDINLYSRQIGAYGLETMEQLIQKKIYIYGVGGVIIKTEIFIPIKGFTVD